MATITRPATSLPNPGDDIEAEQVRDWINNIISFIESTSINEANVNLTATDGIVGKSTSQIITGTKSFTSTSTASGANLAVNFALDPTDDTTSDNDGTRAAFQVRNSAGTVHDMGYLDVIATDVTDGTEDSKFSFSVYSSGSAKEVLTLSDSNLVLSYDSGEYVTHAVSSAGVYSITTTDDSSDSGAITLDTVDSITLDSDTATEGIVYADGGTNLLRISNSSSDVIFKPLVDAKDIVIQQYDGNEVARFADNRRLYLYDEGGEYLSSDGSNLTIASGSAAWVLPSSDGSADQVLKTNGSGTLSWTSVSEGTIGGSTGSTDNVIITANGTGGTTIQANSAVVIDDSSNISGLNSLTLADGKEIIFGTNSDIKLEYDEAGYDSLLIQAGVNDAGVGIVLSADASADAGDDWKINAANGGVLTFGNDIASEGTFVSGVTITPHATATSWELAFVGEISADSLDIGGNVDVDGTLEADAITLGGTALGSLYQALDADLTAIAGLSSSDGNFIVGSSSGWVAESGATARTSLGLGTMAVAATSDYAALSGATFTGAVSITNTTAPLVLKYDAQEYVTHAVSSAGVYSITTTDDSSDSGAITLDTVDKITLDSDTADQGIVYADGGTELMSITNSSSDVIFKPLVDSKDLVIQQYDGNEVARFADNRRLYLYDEGGEYLSSDGSALTIASGSAAWVMPTSDGSANQVLKTDGSGNLDWVTSGGLYSAWSIKTTTYAASSGDQLICNHASTPFTVTLPSSPSGGDTVTIKNVGAATVTIGRNSEEIDEVAADGTLPKGNAVQLVFVDGTIDSWMSL
tara:strand:- start:4304 stop:6733 length:2430 start_codon:yes stop_codon:yes gene_type:complete